MPISAITISKRIILFSHNLRPTIWQSPMAFRWILSLCDCDFGSKPKFSSDIFGYFAEEKYFRVLLSSISSPRLVMLLLLISTLIPKGPLFQAIKYDRLAPEFILPFS